MDMTALIETRNFLSRLIDEIEEEKRKKEQEKEFYEMGDIFEIAGNKYYLQDTDLGTVVFASCSKNGSRFGNAFEIKNVYKITKEEIMGNVCGDNWKFISHKEE